MAPCRAVPCSTLRCRCVPAKRTSNFKSKGASSRKNGNPYISWAFSEAAHFVRRFQPQAQRFYDRKAARTKKIVADRALAHKLAKATYFMLRDQVPYNAGLLFRQDLVGVSPAITVPG